LITPDGVTSINNGTNGLQRLDKVVEIAESMNMFILMTLTNNWNPFPQTNSTRPRNFLSNDYGGMDLYVRQFSNTELLHGQFYTEEIIIDAFKNYSTQVISRYVNSPSVFAWEIANDPRCNSTLPAGPVCTTTTVTGWVSTVAQHIKSVDPNHLVSSGDHGFFCTGCPKLFPKTTPPPPHVSPVPRAARSVPLAATRREFRRQQKAARKSTRKLRKKSENSKRDGVTVRGRWHSPTTQRRQDSSTGPAFDGSFGIDTQDITNIPEVGFGSFQLFPDQNQYFPPDPSLSAFNNTIQEGIDWIQLQAQTGASLGKPMAMTGFGLVTQDNAPSFVPFNSTSAPSVSNTTSGTVSGVTDEQRDDAYMQWLASGITNGVQGMIQYQWGQSNLTAEEGTTISPAINQTTQSPIPNSTGESPNDGYSLSGPGQGAGVAVLSDAVPMISPDT
jgi:mannan endo-1,4-beta-mannosidase